MNKLKEIEGMLYIPELKIYVDLKETQKGTRFKDLKYPKNKRLLKSWEAIFLYENYQDKLNLDCFFIDSKRPVAWFDADSGWVSFGWGPAGSSGSFGVRWCKDEKN
jgi:hypothetical protein